jgi:tetraacyldisaccharide-1-P 4'-kinase
MSTGAGIKKLYPTAIDSKELGGFVLPSGSIRNPPEDRKERANAVRLYRIREYIV